MYTNINICKYMYSYTHTLTQIHTQIHIYTHTPHTHTREVSLGTILSSTPKYGKKLPHSHSVFQSAGKHGS